MKLASPWKVDGGELNERGDGKTQLALQMGWEGHKPGFWAFKSLKRQRDRSTGASRRSMALHDLDPLELGSDFWPLALQDGDLFVLSHKVWA